MLLFLTQTRHKYCQPIQVVITKIDRLKSLRDKMIELDCQGVVNSFLQENGRGLQDQDTSMKKKREQIFEEINQMVSYAKRLEFQIK